MQLDDLHVLAAFLARDSDQTDVVRSLAQWVGSSGVAVRHVLLDVRADYALPIAGLALAIFSTQRNRLIDNRVGSDVAVSAIVLFTAFVCRNCRVSSAGPTNGPRIVLA